jgi:hypothetical protein
MLKESEVNQWFAGKPAELAGPSARFMRFADVAEVNQRASELTKIVAAWCSLEPPQAKPASKG